MTVAHRLGDPDIVHTQDPTECDCRKERKVKQSDDEGNPETHEGEPE